AAIEFFSSFTRLAPGDVIATGTPGGVGFARTPPVWMVPGDVIEVTVEDVGTIRNRVVAEEGSPPDWRRRPDGSPARPGPWPAPGGVNATRSHAVTPPHGESMKSTTPVPVAPASGDRRHTPRIPSRRAHALPFAAVAAGSVLSLVLAACGSSSSSTPASGSGG